MTPFTSTLIISALMLTLSLLPLQFSAVRAHSKLLFLTGTGALLGLLAFDLVPDVLALGGSRSLFWIGLVWAVYSLFHLLHVHHHEGEEAGNVGVFIFAISAHCFASGMLLAVSDEFNATFQKAVFLALLAHKAYEALTVSSIITEKVPSKARALAWLIPYTLSLPLGEGLATVYHAQITPATALLVTCLATGSLLGCLYSDFLLPSLTYVRARKRDLAWVIGGLMMTELVIRLF